MLLWLPGTENIISATLHFDGTGPNDYIVIRTSVGPHFHYIVLCISSACVISQREVIESPSSLLTSAVTHLRSHVELEDTSRSQAGLLSLMWPSAPQDITEAPSLATRELPLICQWKLSLTRGSDSAVSCHVSVQSRVRLSLTVCWGAHKIEMNWSRPVIQTLVCTSHH